MTYENRGTPRSCYQWILDTFAACKETQTARIVEAATAEDLEDRHLLKWLSVHP